MHNNISIQRPANAAILLFVFIILLYGQFLSNPIIFDDLSFFLVDDAGVQPIDAMGFKWLESRSLPYVTLTWTKIWFGLDLIYFRLGNLILHVFTVISLYCLLLSLFTNVLVPKNSISVTPYQAAFIGAMLFGLHPVSTYAVGYLVQRSILMATLFGFLSMLAYVHGSLKKNQALIWSSAPMYYLSVYSKEHAIMMVFVLAALTPLLHSDWMQKLRERWQLFVVMLSVAAFVVISKKWLLGSVYEVDAKALLGADLGKLSYPYSIITQCGLFFKYFALWIFPNVNWMSIDMKEVFVRSINSPHILFVFLYVAWGVWGLWWLLKRGNKGLVGFAMLFPWLLFWSELASIRIQEPFVLYRSYLWAGGGFLALPVLINSFDKKLVVITSMAVGCLLFMLSMERLVTLSNPILVWTDAKKLVEGKPNIQGADRIYYNLGRHLFLSDMLDESEENLKKAIAIAPEFAPPHGVLGAAYNKRNKWEEAVSEYSIAMALNQNNGEPPSSIYLMGRAGSYENSGQLELAIVDYLAACKIDIRVCEKFRKLAASKQ